MIHDLVVLGKKKARDVSEVEGARVLGVKDGVGSLLKVVWSDLDHVKPANGGLVAAVDSLENTGVRTHDTLRRDAAHAKEHVQNTSKLLGLGIVIWRTSLEGPLEILD